MPSFRRVDGSAQEAVVWFGTERGPRLCSEGGYWAKLVQRYWYFGKKVIEERLQLRLISTTSSKLPSGHPSGRVVTVFLICIGDRFGFWMMVLLPTVLGQQKHSGTDTTCLILCGRHLPLNLSPLRTSKIYAPKTRLNKHNPRPTMATVKVAILEEGITITRDEIWRAVDIVPQRVQGYLAAAGRHTRRQNVSMLGAYF